MHRLFAAALAVVLLACAIPDTEAQTARQMRQEVEASMLVTGHVDIDRSGRVTAHALDQPETLPPYVVSLIERTVPATRFEPVRVDGVPVLARAAMSLRLVASAAGNGDMHLRIASSYFGEQDPGTDRSSVRSVRLRPPRYPTSVAEIGGKGTVYLLLKIGRDGRPEEVVAEQVNLTAVGSARDMRMIRDALSKAAIDNALKHWVFAPPTEGDAVANAYWVSRVPVDFAFVGDKVAAYGQWSVYHPGEQVRPVWAAPVAPGFSPDSLVAGTAAPETSRFKLLTPIDG